MSVLLVRLEVVYVVVVVVLVVVLLMLVRVVISSVTNSKNQPRSSIASDPTARIGQRLNDIPNSQIILPDG